MFLHILVATDGSDCARGAVRAAADIARRYEATLTVLHVFEPPLPPVPPVSLAVPLGMDAASLKAWHEANREWAEAMGDSVRHQVEETLGTETPAFTFRQETGHAAETIVRTAEEEHADLIVVGSRGHSAIRSFLLGSVSDRVVQHAHCPVLVIK
jgi:Universal stress protein UspA and related nucleotide-binding proteins